MDITTFSAGIVAAAVVVGGAAKPFLKWRDKRKEASGKAALIDLVINGQPAIPGIREAVISIPIKMENLKKDVSEIQSEQKRQGTQLLAHGDALMQLTGDVRELLASARSIEKKVTANGGESNSMGDVQMRQAKKDGSWLEHPPAQAAGAELIESRVAQEKRDAE